MSSSQGQWNSHITVTAVVTNREDGGHWVVHGIPRYETEKEKDQSEELSDKTRPSNPILAQLLTKPNALN